jgi:hypothetical protein
VGGIVAVVLLTQPKVSVKERYLLKLIQAKSPQLDNLRLFMFLRGVIRPVNQEADLDFQKIFLDDPAQFKALTEQFHAFSANALYSFFGFEAINWELDVKRENPLAARLAASQICKRFPQSAEVIEDLLHESPDAITRAFISQNNSGAPSMDVVTLRYSANLHHALQIIVTGKRNEWWPGTNPDIREWAEETLNRLEKKTQTKES